MYSPLNPLSKNQQEFCTWSGVFGALIAGATLIQHLSFSVPGLLSSLMIPPYLFIISSFVFLALQKAFAPVLLIISTVFSFASCLLVLAGGALSPLLIILMLYTVVITVFIYIEQIQIALRKKLEAERVEKEQWRGKI
ncbi:MAG: hypothetical protein HYZ15_01270 [Sphingobacteriales bacterium]|nr:hypothetical protein [Sphingobacteriales bacterium]